MKMVINCCFGGFSVKDEILERLGLDEDAVDLRYDPQLIAEIEERGSEAVSDTYSRLEVVELPANTTDHFINRYDGLETVFYVVDGKIHII
jgi:hypothetical protein